LAVVNIETNGQALLLFAPSGLAGEITEAGWSHTVQTGLTDQIGSLIVSDTSNRPDLLEAWQYSHRGRPRTHSDS
jgi:hypothetical protein